MRIGLGLACLLTTTLSLGCGDDSPAGDDTGSETGGSSSSTTAMTTASTMPMTSDGTSTGPGESSGDSTAGPGDSTTAGTSEGDSTTAGSSDSGGSDPLYPPCAPDMDPVCPEPYLACYDFAPGYSACTSPCENAGDCPVPDTGDAEVVCAGMMMNQCLLDCSGGATCPDGMECVPVAGGMFNRCLWPDM